MVLCLLLLLLHYLVRRHVLRLSLLLEWVLGKEYKAGGCSGMKLLLPLLDL